MTKEHLDKVEQSTPSLMKERIEPLKKIFPEIFTEGKIDLVKLRDFLGEFADEKSERYAFTWAGKRNAIRLLQTPTRATLIPYREESINFDITGNIFIEGDNLESLKLLYKPYFGRVKVIYIDPPYNTGGDFVYPDNYADPLDTYLRLTGQKDGNGNLLTSNADTNGRYHSMWLSMMYPRLFLARQLLQDDGIIFISIDDHEVHNLRMLMNEVFGEENLLQQIVWQRHAGGGNDSRDFAVDHEYILAYAKNKEAIAKLRLPLSDDEKAGYTGVDEWYLTLGPYKTRSFLRMRPDDPRPGLQYEIELPNGTKIFDEWKWEESRFLEAKEANKIILRKDNNDKWHVEYKIYLNSGGEERKKVPRSLITDAERNSQGKAQLREVFGQDGILNNPKPVGLIKHLLQFSTDHDSIILDFFAGSCTTAQAVLELNRDDGGNRRFIMVQLPEPTPEDSPAKTAGYETIADIGKERLRRVVSKMQKEKDESLPNLREIPEDLGVKIFKLTESNYRLWNGIAEEDPESYAEQMELFADALIEGWTAENVIYEVAIKAGYRLDSFIEQVEGTEKNMIFRVTASDKKQSFFLCLDEELFQEDLNKLELTPDNVFVCRDQALDDTKAANLALQCRLKTI